MEIYNIEEHLNCYCCDKSEKPMVEIQAIRLAEAGETLLSCNQLVFVLAGQLLVTLRDNPGGMLRKGQMVFLPAGDRLNYKALTKSRLLILRLDENIRLCYAFSLEQLYGSISLVEKPKTLVPLEVNDRLLHFVGGIVDMLDDGLRCRVYFQARISSLLTMIRSYYSSKQLCLFFYSVLSPNTFFSEQVRENYLKYRTINDLAAAMNMTPPQFTRRFINIFGQAPYEWVQQEKARLIYEEICNGNKPLKEIAERYGFTVQANFNRFCQTAYATSPGKIRKRKGVKKEEGV